MDKDIFEQLYRQHYAAALLYAQGLCRSRPLAEDMVQEAFCRAWLALPDGVVSFRSWLFRVLRNLTIDHPRRQKHLSDEDVPETADAATPESVLLQREDAAALYRAMERLGAGDREVLTLYCFAHLSGAELAAALLSGDETTFRLFRTEAPELVHLPAATWDWYCRNYLDRYYPVRFILRCNGVDVPSAGKEN